jgi:hypothetical protein
VHDRSDGLEVLGLWLADQHPDIERLNQLDGGAVEEFLVRNRTRRFEDHEREVPRTGTGGLEL